MANFTKSEIESFCDCIENEYSEIWIKSKSESIMEDFNNCLEGTENLSTNYIAHVPIEGTIIIDHYVWSIHGGKNGNGDWTSYMNNLIRVIMNLKRFFNKVTILDIKTDVPDDVFDVRIVCRNMK